MSAHGYHHTLGNPSGSVGAYSGSAGTGIFAHEICICLLNQLENRASSWLEGLLQTASLPSKETGEKPSPEKIKKVFNDGLTMVNTWTPETLQKELKALTQNCPNIRDIYRSVVEIYVASYFQLYPQLSYEISVPNLSVFIHCYYRFLARDPSVRSLNIFQVYGEQQRFVYEGATRNALYHILKRPMQEIFASLENLEKQQSQQGETTFHKRATPSDLAVAPPTLSNPNHMFQQAVQNYMQDVATPAQTQNIRTPKSSAKSGKSVSSKTPSTREKSSASSRSRSKKTVESKAPSPPPISEPIVPLSVPMLPSQKSVGHSKGSVSTHRTIALPTPGSKSKQPRKRRRDGDSDDSYDSDRSSDDYITTDTGSESESGSEGYSSEEERSSKRRHRDNGRERRRDDRHHRSRRR